MQRRGREASEISGSLGTAPSINSSATTAMAQASHGSAPDIAGQNTLEHTQDGDSPKAAARSWTALTDAATVLP
ncbi:isocitrate/isopropylmalate family dehydrogenase [Streptomyces flaveolus]|uniref:isocitrate/isopropylmalate family dehydrogenase n=1 Tax=Streptomyces flaveolus TaxID=67297 RepID=UPI0038253852